MQTQSIGKTYAQLIKFGRLLENHSNAKRMCDEAPEIILSFVAAIERQLRFTKVDDFFTVFPPVKRYENDGSWDYDSFRRMRDEEMGTHFGKDDFKELIMTRSYDNKWLHLVGISFMWAISRAHERQTGRDLLMDFLNK